MKKIKFSTIGTSPITEKMICGAQFCAAFTLHSVYSRSEEKARLLADKFGAAKIYTDLDALAASDTEAVYIASPTALHYTQAKKMLQSGKHVLCEKPACSNLFEVQDLIETAKENKVIFLEAMRPVFSPGYYYIQEKLKQIGKIRHVLFIYCQYSSRYDRFKKGIIENAFRPELSNGALMDIGVYPLHLMISLFGKPNRVFSSSIGLKDSIDACGTAILEYDNFLGEVLYSKTSDSKLPCEIQGEEGNILFSPPGLPTDIQIQYRNGKIEKPNIPVHPWDIFYEVEAFCRMINEGKNADIWNAHTCATIEVMDIIRRQNQIIFPADEKRA